MAGNQHSGRRGNTTQAHIVKGTFRKDRHGEQVTPEAPKGRPKRPKRLQADAMAAQEWARMVARLEELGTLTVVDDAALYQYCRLFAETEQHAVTQAEVSASVQILEENIGDLKGADQMAAFQEIAKMRKLAASYATQIRSGRMGIRQWLVEFGLTPSARSRVKLPPSKPASKVDQFRNAKAGQ